MSCELIMTLSEKKDIKFCACKRQYWTEFYSNRRIQYIFLASPSSFQVLFFRLPLVESLAFEVWFTWGDKIFEVTDGFKSGEPYLCPLTLLNPDRKVFEHLHGSPPQAMHSCIKKTEIWKVVYCLLWLHRAEISAGTLFWRFFLFSGLQCLAYSLDVAVSLLKKCAPLCSL